MTYSARETSIQTGEPRELYEFQSGLTRYLYTSADTDTAWLGDTFKAEAIDRTEFEETDEISRSDLSVTVRRDLPVAELFRVAPPSEVVLLRVYRLHVGDTERKLVWAGRVLNCTWEGVQAVLTAESIYTSLRRPGLRRLYGRACPHVLYGGACGVNELAYKVTPTVFLVSGVTVTMETNDIALLGDGYLAGGFMEYEDPLTSVVTRRAIKSHTGDVIVLTHSVPGLPVGAVVDLYPGCDHSLATCHAKFANSANYGGHPFIPRQNPFGGNSVF